VRRIGGIEANRSKCKEKAKIQGKVHWGSVDDWMPDDRVSLFDKEREGLMLKSWIARHR
jgi:hypothetical protein